MSPILDCAVDEIVAAAANADRRDRVAAVMRRLIDDLHRRGGLVHEADDDEVLLHASDALTIYHITLTPGLQYPPHDHRMDALIGIYLGSELNFVYARFAGKLGAPERLEAIAPDVVRLAPDTVHSVANTGASRSGALHVYFGDLPRQRRQMWPFDRDQADTFDNQRYLDGARRISQRP